MDMATILGIIIGVSLLGGSIILGGNAMIFFSTQSLMIVIGGTLAGTMVSYTFADLIKLPGLMMIAFRDQIVDVDEIISRLVSLAGKARREGLLALEGEAADINDDFLQKGIELVIDGTEPELLSDILETRLEVMEERHFQSRSLLTTMASLSPAFGMIGTLIGLIKMLSALDDPSKLGSGMAVALITTLYGTLLSNLFFTPIADKLKLRSEQEAQIKRLIIQGVLSIQDGENPRLIKEKLSASFKTKPGEKISDSRPEHTVVRDNA